VTTDDIFKLYFLRIESASTFHVQLCRFQTSNGAKETFDLPDGTLTSREEKGGKDKSTVAECLLN